MTCRLPAHINARRTLAALGSVCALACANDVVLGEHVATRTGPSETSTAASTTTTSPSETSASSPTGQPSGPQYSNDDGRPHDNNNDNHPDEWRRDGGFDGAFPDSGPWPPFAPEHPGEGEPNEPPPINSDQSWSGEPPVNPGNFDETDVMDSTNDDFSN